MEPLNTRNPLGDVDPRLLEEAFRRARVASGNARVESDALLSAILAEARRGTRDMYGLVAAAAKATAHAERTTD